MNETITLVDVIDWCGQHIVEIVVILSVFVEITPVKINPITLFLNLLFKPIRNEIAEMKAGIEQNISDLKSELKNDMQTVVNQQSNELGTIDKILESQDLAEMSRIRWEIIEFSNSIENGQLHVRDEYRHIKDDNKKYHQLIEQYHLENGIIDEEIQKINEHYEKYKDSTQIYI